jgi:hypothetical protein
MTTPHRATPEQWADLGAFASDTRACILELRARVEALEAAQLEQAESHRFCTDAIVRRVEALELAHRIQSVTLTSAERAELGVVTRVQLEAAMLRSASDARQTAMDKLRAASAEAQPGGLVERVANAIYNVPHDSAAEARAAIREVAAWLRAGRMLHAAELLEQETDR